MNQGHLYAHVLHTIPGHLTGRMRGVAQISAWLGFEEFTQAELPLCLEKGSFA